MSREYPGDFIQRIADSPEAFAREIELKDTALDSLREKLKVAETENAKLKESCRDE